MTSLIPSAGQAAPAAAAGEKLKLLSDTGGAISEMAIVIKRAWIDDQQRKAALGNLMHALAAHGAQLLVVTAFGDVDKVEAWLKGLGVTGHVLMRAPVPDKDFASDFVWTRDAMLCAARAGGSKVYLRPEANGSNLAYWLAARDAMSITVPDIALDGGDSLFIDDEHWLVGAGAVEKTSKYYGCSWADAAGRIAGAVGRLPTIAGYRSPDVGSWNWVVRRFRNVSRTSLPADFAQASAFRRLTLSVRAALSASQQISVEFMNPDRLTTDWLHLDMVVSATGVKRNGKPLIFVASTTEKPSSIVKGSEAMNLPLNGLAEVLGKAGYEVVRNPAPYVDQRVLGYNNTIVQTDPKKKVWLPFFDIKATDDANYELWKGLGFEVIPVPGWNVFSSDEGAIRCVTLPLNRKAT